MLLDVGLEYLPLGQRLDSLSGGEAQRIKLAAELWKKGRIYVMDEPTIGLHAADIGKLLGSWTGSWRRGNTVIVIEHNLDVIAARTGSSTSARKVVKRGRGDCSGHP